jgi:diguanylate cyclase (GGDEF)-like protein
MSFRARLTLFFFTIVILPMLAVGILVVQVTADSREGQADAEISAGLETARALYDEALLGAPNQARRIARTAAPGQPGGTVADAIRRGDAAALEAAGEREVADPSIASVAFHDAGDQLLARAGSQRAVAIARNQIQLDERPVGSIAVAALNAPGFVRRIQELTGEEVAIVRGNQVLASTRELGEDLPVGDGGRSITLPEGTDARAAAMRLGGAEDARIVMVNVPDAGFVASEPVVAGILVAFFGLALLFIIALLRMLQRQLGAMFEAARKIGGGDFSHEVPVEGNDELAGLAREFNKMSERLSAQMEQLSRQRKELEESVRRIGDAFASGLDRRALLEIVVETALTACDAELARVSLSGHDEPEAEVGNGNGKLQRALEEASAVAAERHGLGSSRQDDVNAIAYPLRRGVEGDEVLGTMAVARTGRPFASSEREVLRYLNGQASVSVENVGLHEKVAEQAVTDELTGLANNRHFREWMERESARVGRFGGELSLVMLDIDDFKPINDTYGHLQGDEVLRKLGEILRLESRGIDEPARYGGEEFVLALPETPKEGAVEVAERVRHRIESAEIQGISGGEPLRVTASLGVATMPGDGAETNALVAAADEALYEAKRTGKNRVIAATGA